MRVVLTNLSDNLYKESRERLNESSKRVGIDGIYSFDFNDIKSSSFYLKNLKILTHKKGLGYWLWKPFIIQESFKKINDGDIVIYSDCGIEIIDDLKPLIDLCNLKEILLFANSNYINRIWTKRDCFVLMNCDKENFWNGIHLDASFCLFKKTAKSHKFLEEWLRYGSNLNIISDQPNIFGKENFPEFVEHRWDQSILSLLAIKFNISTFRMPTQYGNHYKLPEYRVKGEFNCLNQGDQKQLNYYSSSPFENSCYPQILNHHRNKSVKRQFKIFSITEYFIPFLKKVKSFFKIIINKEKINTNLELKNSSFEKRSFSQCGEDLIVKYIFNLRGIIRPSYIDIGANDPFFISNTALFYLEGSRGINIEANPELIEKFQKFRPEDINLNTGIGVKEEELDFYVMQDNTLSTFSKMDHDYMVANGKEVSSIKKIKLTTLSKVLEKHFNNDFPDFLSIDVEGLDIQILKTIDFEKSFPKVICVEAAEYSPIGAGLKRDDIIDFLVSKGYYEYANTNLNSILVKNEFWFI